MKRLLVMAATLAFLLGVGAPAVLAAEPFPDTRSVLVAVNRAVDIPAGDHLDTLVVIGGSARISGDVTTIVVVRGSATLAGATAGTLVVANGSADLQAGTTVSGDVRTLDGSVTQASGATVGGSVKTIDPDLAAFAVLLIPVFILFFLGMGLAAVAAALLVAAFGARQVRSVESLIGREPGPVLLAGIVGTVALPLVATLLIMTVVGAPIGLAIFFILLPALAFLAWIVAAIWIGDWLVARLRGAPEADRPYLAAVLGVIALAFAGVIPFVSGIATLFGFGALLLAAWRTFRSPEPSAGEAGGADAAGEAGVAGETGAARLAPSAS